MKKFVYAELVWAGGLFLLLALMELLTGTPEAGQLALWLGRALALGAFPAAIAIAGMVFPPAGGWRPLFMALALAAAVGLVVFVVFAVLAPAVGSDIRSPGELLLARRAGGGWEAMNDALWRLATPFVMLLQAVLFSLIGLQLGAWSGRALPDGFRRPLYWAAGLGLLLADYSVSDTMYENVVLHTAADLSFAPFVSLLVPGALCAGLALPTLALLRGPESGWSGR